jgi:hypothetical protein
VHSEKGRFYSISQGVSVFGEKIGVRWVNAGSKDFLDKIVYRENRDRSGYNSGLKNLHKYWSITAKGEIRDPFPPKKNKKNPVGVNICPVVINPLPTCQALGVIYLRPNGTINSTTTPSSKAIIVGLICN